MSTSIESHPRRAAPSMSVSSRSPTTSGRHPPRRRPASNSGANELAHDLGSAPVVVMITASQARPPSHRPSAPGRSRRRSSRPAARRAGPASDARLSEPYGGTAVVTHHDQVGLLRFAVQDRGSRRRSTPRERRPGRSRTRAPASLGQQLGGRERGGHDLAPAPPRSRSPGASRRPGAASGGVVGQEDRADASARAARPGWAAPTARRPRPGTGRRRDRTGCSRTARRASSRRDVRARARSRPSRGASRSRSFRCPIARVRCPVCVRTRAPGRSARSRSPARSAPPWRTPAVPARCARHVQRSPERLADRRLVGLDQLRAPRSMAAWCGWSVSRGTPCRARRARRRLRRRRVGRRLLLSHGACPSSRPSSACCSTARSSARTTW